MAKSDGAKRGPRTYQVLREVNSPDDARAWVEVGRYEGFHVEDALKEAIIELGLESGEWEGPTPFLVAVPQRSWKPLRPTVQVQRQIRFNSPPATAAAPSSVSS